MVKERTHLRLLMYFSTNSFQARRDSDNIFKILKEEKLSIKNSVPSKAG